MWLALSLHRYTPFSSMDFAKVSDFGKVESTQ